MSAPEDAAKYVPGEFLTMPRRQFINAMRTAQAAALREAAHELCPEGHECPVPCPGDILLAKAAELEARQ